MMYIWAWQRRRCSPRRGPFPGSRRRRIAAGRRRRIPRDQRGEVAGFGQGVDELGGIGAVAVQLAPVLAGETGAELGNLGADFGVRIGGQGLVDLGPGASPTVIKRLGSGAQANQQQRP